MKKKVFFVVCISIVALAVGAGVVVLSLLGAHGYFAYQKIKTVVSAPAVTDDGAFVIMSANIRRKENWYSLDKHDLGKYRWYKRADAYLRNIWEVRPDIFGAQEVKPAQFDFLKTHLSGYESVVGYRDNSGLRSESSPIFYNKERFTLLDGGIFWLSETPEKMSVSWTIGGEYRIATFAELKDKVTGETIAVFNAHPDWDPASACKEEIKVIAAKAAEMLEKGDKVIVFGDLNSDIHTESGADAQASLGAILENAIDVAGEDYGYTFNGYDLDPHEELDYFYVSAGAEISELKKIDKTYNGIFPSDHFPIYAKIKF